MSFSLSGSLAGMICGGLAGVVFFFLSILLFVNIIRDKQKAQASLSWPSVEGKIMEQRVSRSEVHDEDGVHISYTPEVVFEYTVEGLSFQGQRIAFGSEPSFSSHRKAEAFLAAYPEDRAIMVYYNPEDPSDAVLSQTMRSFIGGIIGGLVLLATSLFLMFQVAKGLINAFFP